MNDKEKYTTLLKRIKEFRAVTPLSDDQSLKCFDLLEIVATSVEKNHYSPEQGYKILNGIGVSCLKQIESMLYIWNSYPPIYQHLLDLFEFKSAAETKTKSALVNLVELYKHTTELKTDDFETLGNDELDEKNFEAELERIGLTIESFKQNIETQLCTLLSEIPKEINYTVKAIPVEEHFSKEIADLEIQYRKDKEKQAQSFWGMFGYGKVNPDRIFSIQLSQAIVGISSALLKDDNNNQPVDKTQLTSTEKIKIAVLVLMGHHIFNSAFSSVTNYSQQYANICRILEVNNISQYDAQVQHECLLELLKLFEQKDFIQQITTWADEHIKTNNQLVDIEPKLKEFLSELKKLTTITPCPGFTYLPEHFPIATAFSKMLAPLGYAGGYVFAWIVCQTDTVLPYKTEAMKVVGALFRETIGLDRISFLGAHKWVDGTLERAFAQLFEAAIKITAYGTFSSLDCLWHLNVQGFRALAHECLSCAKHVDPALVKNEMELVHALLALPPKIFSADKQHRLEQAAALVPARANAP